MDMSLVMDNTPRVAEGYSDPRDAANEPPPAEITVCGELSDGLSLVGMFCPHVDCADAVWLVDATVRQPVGRVLPLRGRVPCFICLSLDDAARNKPQDVGGDWSVLEKRGA